MFSIFVIPWLCGNKYDQPPEARGKQGKAENSSPPPGARAGRKAGAEKGDLALASHGVMVGVIRGCGSQGPLGPLESMA